MDDEEEDGGKQYTYADLVYLLMEKTSAQGVVMIVLGGEHGSKSLVAVKHPEVFMKIPDALRMLLENVEKGLHKSSTH